VDGGNLPFKPTELTPRERECLLWAAEGKTSWETAQILGISERTVIFHLRNVTEKLNVSSRQQAIARAISQGLIAPQLI
jgi:LuxR family transcriptional activator of bioluminescence operon